VAYLSKLFLLNALTQSRATVEAKRVEYKVKLMSAHSNGDRNTNHIRHTGIALLPHIDVHGYTSL
jgi:hypothetical protein